MNDISSQLSCLKDKMEGTLKSATFLIGKGILEKELHDKIVQNLDALCKIEASGLPPRQQNDHEAKEIEKVESRVPRWFRNPHQFIRDLYQQEKHRINQLGNIHR